jgi:hypothetical protein
MPHLHWRINIFANAGDASLLAISEIEMRATAGGADQCTGGTATASSATSGFEAPNAFDNSATTRWSTAAGPNWIAYQFPSAVDVAEYTIQAHETLPSRSPRDWQFEYSDDGVTWTPIEDRYGVTGWTSGQIRTFTLPTTDPVVRVSQVVSEVLRIDANPPARVSQVVVEVIRPNATPTPPTSSIVRPVICICM